MARQMAPRPGGTPQSPQLRQMTADDYSYFSQLPENVRQAYNADLMTNPEFNRFMFSQIDSIRKQQAATQAMHERQRVMDALNRARGINQKPPAQPQQPPAQPPTPPKLPVQQQPPAQPQQPPKLPVQQLPLHPMLGQNRRGTQIPTPPKPPAQPPAPPEPPPLSPLEQLRQKYIQNNLSENTSKPGTISVNLADPDAAKIIEAKRKEWETANEQKINAARSQIGSRFDARYQRMSDLARRMETGQTLSTDSNKDIEYLRGIQQQMARDRYGDGNLFKDTPLSVAALEQALDNNMYQKPTWHQRWNPFVRGNHWWRTNRNSIFNKESSMYKYFSQMPPHVKKANLDRYFSKIANGEEFGLVKAARLASEQKEATFQQHQALVEKKKNVM